MIPEIPILPILTPTRGPWGIPGSTMLTLSTVAFNLKRIPVYFEVTGAGYAWVRSDLFNYAKTGLQRDRVRGILIDDDILVNDGIKLTQAIQKADENNWNFVSPYKCLGGIYSIASVEKFHMLSEEEIQELKDWDVVENSGLGFYYGDIPLTYKFSENGKFQGGEDLNFFHDNNLQIRIVGMKLKHIKQQPLESVL
jgi:hypothetical protein